MSLIKNTSRGPRTVEQVLGDRVQTRILNPGESFDGEVLETDVFKSQVANREFEVDGGVDTEKQEALGEVEDLKAQLAEANRKLAEIQTNQDALRHASDPHARDNRQAAMIAGNTPGLADPLPPGTDTKGGEESKRALENLGHGDAQGSDLQHGEELRRGGPDRHGGTSASPAPAQERRAESNFAPASTNAAPKEPNKGTRPQAKPKNE
jgi:hypothetical protein